MLSLSVHRSVSLRLVYLSSLETNPKAELLFVPCMEMDRTQQQAFPTIRSPLGRSEERYQRALHDVAAMFQSMSRDEISALGYMHPGRVDVITAGSLVLSRVLHATGAREFVASESDILDGIAWGLASEPR